MTQGLFVPPTGSDRGIAKQELTASEKGSILRPKIGLWPTKVEPSMCFAGCRLIKAAEWIPSFFGSLGSYSPGNAIGRTVL